MADIKTRDMVKGSIKTIDKSAVAAQRMKYAFIQTKEKAEHAIHTQEAVRKNMRQTEWKAVLTGFPTKPYTNLTSKVAKALRRQSRMCQRQKTVSGLSKKNGRHSRLKSRVSVLPETKA